MEDTQFISHEPCENPSCDSSDGRAVYDDGHSYCFSCGTYTPAEGRKKQPVSNNKKKKGKTERIQQGSFQALPVRLLTKDTCNKFRYHIAQVKGNPTQVADYINNDREVVAQKVRFRNKDFWFLKFGGAVPLFGQHLWKAGGKKLVITEGEIDAMSVSQVQDHRWPVVSIPNGTKGAKKSIQENLEYVESFEEVIFMFDMDKPGQEAAVKCAKLLTPGKAFIATLSMNDPNELLKARKGKDIINAIWQAKEYKVSGIIDGKDTLEAVLHLQNTVSDGYPFECLNQKLRGIRKMEITTICAGSGIGKSQLCREIGYHIADDKKIGYIPLEESTAKAALGFMSIQSNQLLHLRETPLSDEETTKLHGETFNSHSITLYNGSLDVEELASKIKYLATGLDVDYVVLDHISIIVSGLTEGDERRTIDNIMTRLRNIVDETGIGLILVSHLKRPASDKGHEDGAQTSMSQLRGSAAIGQLSDIVIGAERDQQGEFPNILLLRILKNRFSGETGIAGLIKFDSVTGRMTEITKEDLEDCPFDEKGPTQTKKRGKEEPSEVNY